jgi:hypothetical protein
VSRGFLTFHQAAWWPLSIFSSVLGLKGTHDPHNLCNPAHSSTEAYYFTLYMIFDTMKGTVNWQKQKQKSNATCNGGNITISSDAIRESSECITDSTRTPSIVENIVGASHSTGFYWSIVV